MFAAKVMYGLQNMSAGLSRRCLAANPTAPHLCFLAPHMAAFVQTPTFLLQARPPPLVPLGTLCMGKRVLNGYSSTCVSLWDSLRFGRVLEY